MRTLIKITVVATVFAALFLFDLLSLTLVPEAEAIAGVRRRTARRTAIVVGSSSAAASSASQQQQAATAQQQSETAQQQSATAQQQSATAQQQAAAAQPAPTAMVASLPDGCVSDGKVFKCGDTYYQPYMQGNQVVYGAVAAPQ